MVCLTKAFPQSSVVDRREAPNHGYRAVQVIVRQFGMPVEVQIRTELEHSWAQLSEKLSDVVNPSVKYGGGPELLRSTLYLLSDLLGQMEALERRLLAAQIRPQDRESVSLDLEIELRRRGQSHEVVLLDAASEEALRKTHGRYFDDIEDLLAAVASF